MQLKLDMSCHLLNVYTKFQIDISKHVEEKSGKRGRTDGRTLPRHNTSHFSNGRIMSVKVIFLKLLLHFPGINSLRLSDVYMCRHSRTSLVQIMACRLFGAKPLSKPMLEYCHLDP